jgi:hypothetical protein
MALRASFMKTALSITSPACNATGPSLKSNEKY